VHRVGILNSIQIVGGVPGPDKSSSSPRQSFIEGVSHELESGLDFETEEPIQESGDEAALRTRLREIDEAQRRSEFESRESYVS
jgi:hypothetical protein